MIISINSYTDIVNREDKELTDEQYEQMMADLEDGAFVPTANVDAPTPLYSGYSGWWEFLDEDEVAREEITSQYLALILSRNEKLH
jgi:hypothetical protein